MKIVGLIYKEWKHTTPNYLTLARLAAGLWGLNAFYWPGLEPWSMLLLCLVSGFFDKLDGWWARTFKEESVAGKLLDPLADKILGWNAVAVVGHYFLTSNDTFLLLMAAACLLPLALNALYDFMAIKMRGMDNGMKTNEIAQKKQAILFVSFGMFLITLAYHHTSPQVESGELATILYATSLLFALGGTFFQWLAVRLLAKSARIYLAQTRDQRALEWAQVRWVSWILRTL